MRRFLPHKELYGVSRSRKYTGKAPKYKRGGNHASLYFFFDLHFLHLYIFLIYTYTSLSFYLYTLYRIKKQKKKKKTSRGKCLYSNYFVAYGCCRKVHAFSFSSKNAVFTEK